MMLVMAVRLAQKLPQTLVLPTEVSERRVYLGVESHDVKVILAQLRKAPCVTVQVKDTTSPGHAAVLPSCSRLDTWKSGISSYYCTLLLTTVQPFNWYLRTVSGFDFHLNVILSEQILQGSK